MSRRRKEVREETEEESVADEDSLGEIKIRNIVCSVNLGLKLDLKKIALTVRNAEYNPKVINRNSSKRFSAAILKIRNPRATALIFSSGKMVCMGTKSVDECKKAARCFEAIISKIGFSITNSDPVIHNMVGTTDCGYPIRLEGIAHDFSSISTYEPELFPGLIYRIPNQKIIGIIFVSGKMVITGAKNMEQIQQAKSIILQVIEKYRKVKTMKNL